MTHPERVTGYLEDIAECIERATGYLREIDDFSVFEQDHRNQDAVLRNIMIIGEAVSKIQRTAPEFIEAHPDVPWAQIRAMRNLVIHEYSYVDLRIVWQTVKDAMPVMKQQIEDFLVQHSQTREKS